MHAVLLSARLSLGLRSAVATVLGVALWIPDAASVRTLLLHLLLGMMLVYTASLACKAPDYPGHRSLLILESAALLGALLLSQSGDSRVSTWIANAFLLTALANAAVWFFGRRAAAPADEAEPRARDAFDAVCLSHLVIAALLPQLLLEAHADWGESTRLLAFALLFAGGWGLRVACDLAAFKPALPARRRPRLSRGVAESVRVGVRSSRGARRDAIDP